MTLYDAFSTALLPGFLAGAMTAIGCYLAGRLLQIEPQLLRTLSPAFGVAAALASIAAIAMAALKVMP